MKIIKMMAIVYALVFSATAIAQEKGTSEISFGYGGATSYEVENTLGDMLSTIITLGTVSYDDVEYTGAFHAKYKYAIIDNLLVGISGVYEEAEDKERFGSANVAKRKSRIYSIALESDYSYINRKHFKVYSGVGLGYRMVDTKSKPTAASTDTKISNERTHGLAYHINGIGIRAGRAIGVFVEVGYGYRGIINAGLSIQF
ncbi:hypothetical protein [Maribacter sp. 2210JD10-5]|uniref:hypothetical protein n=1 Tax=Maribacter sp. 2210JD10-5 TaxID=3386272 RepID=UPI0039BD2C35